MTIVTIEKPQHDSDVKPKLTLEEFLRLPEIDESYELVDRVAIKKMPAKFFRSSLTTAFWTELSSWCDGFGQVAIEWSVALKRKNVDWVPVPNLLYISHDRLAADWREDAPSSAQPCLS